MKDRVYQKNEALMRQVRHPLSSRDPGYRWTIPWISISREARGYRSMQGESCGHRAAIGHPVRLEECVEEVSRIPAVWLPFTQSWVVDAYSQEPNKHAIGILFDVKQTTFVTPLCHIIKQTRGNFVRSSQHVAMHIRFFRQSQDGHPSPICSKHWQKACHRQVVH